MELRWSCCTPASTTSLFWPGHFSIFFLPLVLKCHGLHAAIHGILVFLLFTYTTIIISHMLTCQKLWSVLESEKVWEFLSQTGCGKYHGHNYYLNILQTCQIKYVLLILVK